MIITKTNLHNQNIHQLNKNQKIVGNKHLIHHILVNNNVQNMEYIVKVVIHSILILMIMITLAVLIE